MAGCHCSNIEIMQLFHELKQKFPVVPDYIVTQCIHQNGHNKDLCENELEEENNRYLTHCFPQGLVDKMNTPTPSSPFPSDEAQVYLERGYPRRSLDSAQCSRRKSSSGSDDVGSVVSKHSSKVIKKLGLGLPPKNAKRLHKKHGADWTTHGGGKHATSEMEIAESSEKRHHRHTPIKVDHRGNPERYTMFDEITAKGKYKKLSSELDDITNTANITNVSSMLLRADVTNLGDVTMSVADQQKLCVAQQMLGLRECDETIESTSTGGKSTSTSTEKAASLGKSATNENRRTPRQHLSPRRHKHYSRTESKVSPSRRTNSGSRKTYSTQHSVPEISLPSPSIDQKISSQTRWNFQPSPNSPQPTQKQFNQPSTSNTNQGVTTTASTNLGVPTEHINLGNISPSIRFQGNIGPNIQGPGSKSKDRESLKLDLFSQNPQSPIVPNIQYQSSYHSNQVFSSKQSVPSNQDFPVNQGSPSKQSVPSNKGSPNNPFFPSNQGVFSNQASSSNQSFLSNQGFHSNQSGVPNNQFRLSVPSSANELTSVSVLSYSAPSTPMSCSSPLFPPLAVDVNTGGHRTSLSLEPLPHYGLSEDSARPLTKVTLSLRPPGDDTEALAIPSNAASGLTYTSYSLKDGVQAHQLHISIGPTGPQQANSNMNLSGPQGANRSIDSSDHASTSSSTEPHGLPQNISDVTKSILIAQKERKAKLMTALMCEKERLNGIKRNIHSIEERMRLVAYLQKVPSRSPRISKLRLEIKTLHEECARMTKAVEISPENTGTDEPGDSPGWKCDMCTLINHPLLPKCEACDLPRVNVLDNKLPASLSCI
ncbi:hypothetical protein WDU94_005033 [Cyamophila willieti]